MSSGASLSSLISTCLKNKRVVFLCYLRFLSYLCLKSKTAFKKFSLHTSFCLELYILFKASLYVYTSIYSMYTFLKILNKYNPKMANRIISKAFFW